MIKISDTEYFSNDKTIRFLNMDCNEFMAGCKDNEFDLIHNDPPYGLDLANMNMGAGKSKKCSRIENRKWISKDWDKTAPNTEHFEECFRISKNQIIWGGNYFGLPMFKHYLIWDKEIPNGLSFADCEMAWTSFLKAPRMFRYSAYLDKSDKMHPTQKPISLYNYVCDNYTKPTDTILDCFGGSMSNAIACHMKRRKLTIIELDSEYFASALLRFSEYEQKVEDIKEFGYAKTKINSVNPTLF